MSKHPEKSTANDMAVRRAERVRTSHLLSYFFPILVTSSDKTATALIRHSNYKFQDAYVKDGGLESDSIFFVLRSKSTTSFNMAKRIYKILRFFGASSLDPGPNDTPAAFLNEFGNLPVGVNTGVKILHGLKFGFFHNDSPFGVKYARLLERQRKGQPRTK